MPNYENRAALAEGVTAGLANVSRYLDEKPERDARRAEAKLQQEIATSQLQEYRQNAPVRKSQAELELQELKMKVRAMQAAHLRDATYYAFDLYESDGDIKHLNNFLNEAKNNDLGKATYSRFVRLDALQDSDETRQLLRQAGYENPDAILKDKELAKNFVLGTEQEGTHTLLDMTQLYAGTGYTQRAEERKLKLLRERAAINKLLQNPGGTGDHQLISDIAESEGISFSEAARQFFAMKRQSGGRSGDYNLIHELANEKGISLGDAMREFYGMKRSGVKSGSTVERVAEDLRAKDPNLSLEQSLKEATKLTESRTSDQKNLGTADQVRADIDKAAGGNLFDADMNDSKVRRAVGPKITELEKYTGKELSQEDKRVARQMRSLIALGGSAGKNLTEEETGLLDSTLSSFKKYISDEVGSGTEGTAAYETFRNTLRNALYGASLTASEISAFNNAAGSLKQKAGPVLQQLRVQMSDVREQLQTIYDFNDEYIAHYYLGRSREDIDQVIEALDARIKYFENYSANSEKFEEKRFSKQPAQNLPPLEEVWDTLEPAK